MNKLDIELNDRQIEELRRKARQAGMSVSSLAAAIVRETVADHDKHPTLELSLRSRTIAVEMAHDEAIVLLEALHQLGGMGPIMAPETTDRAVRVDEALASVLDNLKTAIESELPGDYSVPDEYPVILDLARKSLQGKLNWLDSKTIQCPGCDREMGSSLHSPFCGSWLIGCEACPRIVEIFGDDPVVEGIVEAAIGRDLSEEEYESELDRHVEQRLRPCACGGFLRFGAFRRCPRCATVIPPQPGDVGEPRHRDIYAPGASRPRLPADELWLQE